MSDNPIRLIEELRAKAAQSYRAVSDRRGKRVSEHVCSRAADKLEELVRGENGRVPVRSVREIFTRLLNLGHDQRAYSWHEIQYALAEVERAKND